MVKWIIRGCLAFTVSACLIVMGVGAAPAFAVASVLLVVSVCVYVAMLEEVE
jgi:hypothetical protein